MEDIKEPDSIPVHEIGGPYTGAIDHRPNLFNEKHPVHKVYEILYAPEVNAGHDPGLSVPNRHINPVGNDGANKDGDCVHLLHSEVIVLPKPGGRDREVSTGVALPVIIPHGDVNGPVAIYAGAKVIKDTKTIDLPLAFAPV